MSKQRQELVVVLWNNFVFEKKHMFDLFSAGREIIDSICAYVLAATM